MLYKIGKEYFYSSHIESVELTNNDKSIILHTSSGRSFMYDVDEVPGLVDITIKNLPAIFDMKKSMVWSSCVGTFLQDAENEKDK